MEIFGFLVTPITNLGGVYIMNSTWLSSLQRKKKQLNYEAKA